MNAAGRRDKGRRGQCEARRLLSERDWSVVPLAAGMAVEDVLAIDARGVLYAWEVKACKTLDLPRFLKQARDQAKKRKARWALLCRLPEHPRAWLVYRQDEAPTVWHAKGGE